MSERMKRKGSTRTSFYEQQPEEVGAYEKIPKRTNIHQLNVGHRLMSIKKESDEAFDFSVKKIMRDMKDYEELKSELNSLKSGLSLDHLDYSKTSKDQLLVLCDQQRKEIEDLKCQLLRYRVPKEALSITEALRKIDERDDKKELFNLGLLLFNSLINGRLQQNTLVYSLIKSQLIFYSFQPGKRFKGRGASIFDPVLSRFCLTFFCRHGRGPYEALRGFTGFKTRDCFVEDWEGKLILPCLRTLQRYVSASEISAGIHLPLLKECADVFLRKAESLDGRILVASLNYDETDFGKATVYMTSDGTIQGSVDFGDDQISFGILNDTAATVQEDLSFFNREVTETVRTLKDLQPGELSFHDSLDILITFDLVVSRSRQLIQDVTDLLQEKEKFLGKKEKKDCRDNPINLNQKKSLNEAALVVDVLRRMLISAKEQLSHLLSYLEWMQDDELISRDLTLSKWEVLQDEDAMLLFFYNNKDELVPLLEELVVTFTQMKLAVLQRSTKLQVLLLYFFEIRFGLLLTQ